MCDNHINLFKKSFKKYLKLKLVLVHRSYSVTIDK